MVRMRKATPRAQTAEIRYGMTWLGEEEVDWIGGGGGGDGVGVGCENGKTK